MGCKKRYLSLLLLMCVTSSVFVGCNNKEALSNNNSEEVEMIGDSNSDSEEVLEESDKSTLITKEEALKLVEKEVLKVFPNAKLKFKSDEYPNEEGLYVIKYDAPYCTISEFVVDPYTGDIQVCEAGDRDFMDMDKWRERIKEYSNSEIYKQITAKEAMAKFVSKYNFNESHENGTWFRLSDSQLNNFELVSEELVEYKPGSCAWVFRYPLEEELSIYGIYDNLYDEDCTIYNAVSKDDKYGYMFFEPQKVDSRDETSTYCTHVCNYSLTSFCWEKYPSEYENDY